MRNEDLFDLEEQPSHIDYREYKNKVTKNPNESVIMFISAFFVMLLLFLGIAKQMSPDVDVTIGNGNQTSEDAVNDYVNKSIDNRLKLIQMEDAGMSTDNGDSIFDDTLEERVVLPTNVRKISREPEATIPNDPLPSNDVRREAVVNSINEQPQTVLKQEEPVARTQSNTEEQQAQTPVNAKVVVGYYTTIEQAQVARGILMDAGLNINPFIKQIGGAYTIQVGSFSTREKAQTAANEMIRNNFPARIIVEQ